MPAKYTLYYFGGRGRGETVRQMLHLGGVQWEDIRYEKPEWDESIKKGRRNKCLIRNISCTDMFCACLVCSPSYLSSSPHVMHIGGSTVKAESPHPSVVLLYLLCYRRPHTRWQCVIHGIVKQFKKQECEIWNGRQWYHTKKSLCINYNYSAQSQWKI